MEIPFINGPLAGQSYSHDGEDDPPPGVIVEPPVSFEPIPPPSSTGDSVKFTVTRHMWIYALAGEEHKPEYRIAPSGSELVAEQQRILDAAVRSAFDNIVR